MSSDPAALLNDIVDNIERIQSYVLGLDRAALKVIAARMMPLKDVSSESPKQLSVSATTLSR